MEENLKDCTNPRGQKKKGSYISKFRCSKWVNLYTVCVGEENETRCNVDFYLCAWCALKEGKNIVGQLVLCA